MSRINIPLDYIKMLFIGLSAMVAVTANATRAAGVPRIVTLDNGKQVTIRLVGNQNLHFFVTDEGEVVMEENGNFRLASMLEVENIRDMAKQSDASESAVAMPFGVMSSSSARESVLPAPTSQGEGIDGIRVIPCLGTPKILTVMVDFSDIHFRYSQEDIHNLLNSTEYNTTDRYKSYGSVAQYFDDCSFGQFRPQFDVVASITLNNPSAYYGKSTSGNTDNSIAFLTEVCTKLSGLDIDFNQYDMDNDGYIDMVYIVYAGYSEAVGAGSDCLWPQSGYTSYINVSLGGKKFFRYAYQNELYGAPYTESSFPNGNPMAGIGVHVHEFCHAMGLPDYYPTVDWFTSAGVYDVQKYDNLSMEYWDLMDGGENINNGFAPAPLSAWQRELFGWTDKMNILSEADNVTLIPLKDGGESMRIVNDNNPNEFWIIENMPRESKGWYANMPGSGMLVTHVNYDRAKFNAFNKLNNTPGHPDITIIPADGWLPSLMRCYLPSNNVNYLTYKQYRDNHKGDTYPLLSDTLTVTSLTDYKAYAGTVDKPITDIQLQSDGSVTFKFRGGKALLGDVNGDGVITIADANAIVNYYLGNTVESFNAGVADVNGDGEITVSDANVIVNMFLEQ